MGQRRIKIKNILSWIIYKAYETVDLNEDHPMQPASLTDRCAFHTTYENILARKSTRFWINPNLSVYRKYERQRKVLNPTGMQSMKSRIWEPLQDKVTQFPQQKNYQECQKVGRRGRAGMWWEFTDEIYEACERNATHGPCLNPDLKH